MLTENTITFEQLQKLETAGLRSCRQLPTNPHHLIQPLLNLYIQFLKEPSRGKLLIVLFLILPWDLGKHLYIVESFVDGLAVPYLVPVLYLQDISIAVVVGLWILAKIRLLAGGGLDRLFSTPLSGLISVRADSAQKISVDAFSRLFLLFITASGLSVFFAERLVPPVYFFCRLGLYFVFFATSWDLFTRPFIRKSFFAISLANLLLLCTLGLTQFNRQASVFNNYLIFGEQPYTVYTPFIAKKSFDGITKIPPYGLFEHPNIFAGHLGVFLTWLASCLLGPRTTFRFVGSGLLIFGLYVLDLTKSTPAWYAVSIGVVVLIFYRLAIDGWVKHRFGDRLVGGASGVLATLRKSLVVLIGVGIVIAGLTLPLLDGATLKVLPTDSNRSVLSVERRAGLLTASYQMFLEKPFFGWGINSFTYSLQPYFKDSVLVRFHEPVHNVFALVLVETGIFGLFFFLTLIFYTLYQTGKYKNPLYSVVLLQIVFLSSFDHYFFTIHQTLLLFILTLMLALTYTESTDCL